MHHHANPLKGRFAAGVLLLVLGGCTNGDPIRNLAGQDGNAGPPARSVVLITPVPGGTRVALGQPVLSSRLPPPGLVQIGDRQ